jgi:hypothetical protein
MWHFEQIGVNTWAWIDWKSAVIGPLAVPPPEIGCPF